MKDDGAAGASDGLRARNRELTTRRLEQAAWEIAAEEGFEAVTADAVADRAGVSRRTFFNYFPRVELVLQERLRSTIAGLVDRFVERPRDEGLHESLIAVLTDPLEAEILERSVLVFGQAKVSAAAQAFLMDAQAAESALIAEALLDRLGPGADPLFADVVARTTMVVGCAATEAWVDRVDGVVDDTTRQLHLDLLRQGFAHLATAFTLTAPADDVDDAGGPDLSATSTKD